MLTKTQINRIITNYCKEHHIRKSTHHLYPVYIHLNGFSHSIGFTSAKPLRGQLAINYNTVGWSAYTHNAWGYINEHQRKIALTILSNIPHYCYQNNAKEILL